MKKYMSKKERDLNRRIRRFSLFFVIIIFAICLVIVAFDSPSNEDISYTEEELAHDHDGDGIPDHGVSGH